MQPTHITPALKSIDASWAEIRNLQKELEGLQQKVNSSKEEFVARLEADGWQRFEYFSSYYGSHSERGGGDRSVTYFFHPSVDLSGWTEVSFSHGDRGQHDSNSKFDDFLRTIPADKLIEF